MIIYPVITHLTLLFLAISTILIKRVKINGYCWYNEDHYGRGKQCNSCYDIWMFVPFFGIYYCIRTVLIGIMDRESKIEKMHRIQKAKDEESKRKKEEAEENKKQELENEESEYRDQIVYIIKTLLNNEYNVYYRDYKASELIRNVSKLNKLNYTEPTYSKVFCDHLVSIFKTYMSYRHIVKIRGIFFNCLDVIYSSTKDFEEISDELCETLVETMKEYVKTVKLIAIDEKIKAEENERRQEKMATLAAQSKLKDIRTYLGVIQKDYEEKEEV